MKKFEIEVIFTFKGIVEIQANTKQEAKERVSKDFGLTLTRGLHSSNPNIVDWTFPINPEKKIVK